MFIAYKAKYLYQNFCYNSRVKEYYTEYQWYRCNLVTIINFLIYLSVVVSAAS